ncbi:hypothetical protein GCM10009504_15050 [Pseudomonas laurentiana]|nr:hypothetical protein GCM10009504_15050 [Pseudomonas laurentiana]
MGHTVLVGIKAAMGMIMVFLGVSCRERQQGKRQGKQQTAHGTVSVEARLKAQCYNKLLGGCQRAWRQPVAMGAWAIRRLGGEVCAYSRAYW